MSAATDHASFDVELLLQKKLLFQNKEEVQKNRLFKLQHKLFRLRMLNLLFKFVRHLFKWLEVEFKKHLLLQKDKLLFIEKEENLLIGHKSN
jgi:hypothetical protein